MATTIRPEVVENNPYRIERQRYYELKHFCLQYPIWRKMYATLDSMSKQSMDLSGVQCHSEHSDPTAKCAELMDYYDSRMRMLEDVAMETDREIATYILKGVTSGISYDILNLKYDSPVPCSKDTYYNLYRRFFWLLDQARG